MIKKINICLDFNNVPPLSRWHHPFWSDCLFGRDNFNFVGCNDFKKEESNFLFLYCVPDHTVEFLESREDDFYKTVKEKKIKLLFYNEQFSLFMFEGNIFKHNPDIKHHCYDINDILYWKISNIFKKHNIGEESFYFIHSAKGFLKEIEEMKIRKILWINSTLDIKSKHIRVHPDLAWGGEQKISVRRNLQKHYACLFGGRPTRYRHYLVKDLWKRNLITFGKCSLNPCPDQGDDSEFASISLPPIDFTSHWKMQKYHEDGIFEDIFLWVAAETYCPNGYPYFTEKTIKPILYERPFISYGNPGTLSYLRDYGFKTFGDFWDESYDEEKDDDKKIRMIANIIESICNKDLDEINEIYDQMMPILEHNKNLLMRTNWREDLVKFLS